jgi:glutaredoxin
VGADDVAHGVPDITVYGARTCEDTAITESRLLALRIPFRSVDIDADPQAARRMAARSGGRRVTPTVLVGENGPTATEPSIEQLDALLGSAGFDVRPPGAIQFHRPLADRPLPMRTLADTTGGRFSLETLRSRRQAAIFFGHGPACRACAGYAKQLALQHDAMEAAGGVPVVVEGPAAAARAWTAEMAPGMVVLGDSGGTWQHAVASAVGASPRQVMPLLLDRWGAPRAGSFADEAGGLLAPGDATGWLRFLALECPECAGELPWLEDRTVPASMGRQRANNR